MIHPLFVAISLSVVVSSPYPQLLETVTVCAGAVDKLLNTSTIELFDIFPPEIDTDTFTFAMAAVEIEEQP